MIGSFTARHLPRTLALALVLSAALVSTAGRSESATPPAALAPGEFSFVVIPDTQSYLDDDAFPATFGAQTQWIVDHRSDLNVKFVAHLGDLTELWPDVTQWQRASQYMATLDTAGIPNSVLPGNHDMNVTTGEAPRFDEFFPPSRYASAPSYGGYLGQNLFGPDPVDRKNKDNFSLFSSGDLDFLVLNLEYDPPDYVLDWAQKVLDAYPQRRVILTTHSFIHTAGARSSTTTRLDAGANTPVQVWNELVYRNCSIFMVVNGHWHDGELSEARRSDPNACGKPVQQLLTNYQDRANGGDGWLRYYTFKPATNTIEAVTYSPTLDRYDAGALAAFSFPYDMSAPAGTTPKVLIAGGSSWRWQYVAGSWPAGWTTAGFDDSSWRQGPAALGFGPGVATNIDVPPPTSNRPRSAQFRRAFTVSSAAALTNAAITTRGDDGVVVYVNGTEVGRAGMPSGTLTSGSYPLAAPRTSAAPTVTFPISAGLLRDGSNIVSASTHLNYRDTPDISFDLALTADEATGPAQPPAAPTVTGTNVGADGVALSWPAVSGADSYRVSRDGVLRGTVTAPAHAYQDTGLAPATTYTYTVVAVAGALASSPGTATVTTPPASTPPTATTIVPAGSSWRWRFSAGAWPAGWTATAFDDSGWNQGAAVLGFGSTGLATNIDVPAPTSNRPLSAQFRRSFTVANVGALSDVTVTSRANDGVVIWVNGTEIGRSGLPTGTLTAGSYATAAPNAGAAATVTYAVPLSALRVGTNVVTASTHLNYRATRDIGFELVMTALTTAP